MSIFAVENYRDLLRQQMERNASVRGYQGLLARAAGVSSSYLSQVLKGPVQLTPDQALAFCEFWKWDDHSTQYFLTLVNFDRAGTSKLKARLAKELQNLRFQSSSSLTRINHGGINARKLNREHALTYWSQWYYAAIRECLFLNDCRTPSVIAARLSLPEPLVLSTLRCMEEMSLVKEDDGESWSPIGQDIVEGDDDLLITLFHGALRQKTIYNLGMGRRDGDIAYSWIDSISKDDFPKVRDLIRSFLRSKAELMKTTEKEELVCLCLDFFRL